MGTLPWQESFIQRLDKMCKIYLAGIPCYSVMTEPSPSSMRLHPHKPHGHFSHTVGSHRTPPGLRLCRRESLQKLVSSSLCLVSGGGGKQGRLKGCGGTRLVLAPVHLLSFFPIWSNPPWTLMHAPLSLDCPSNIPECSLGAGLTDSFQPGFPNYKLCDLGQTSQSP